MEHLFTTLTHAAGSWKEKNRHNLEMKSRVGVNPHRGSKTINRAGLLGPDHCCLQVYFLYVFLEHIHKSDVIL